MVKPYSIQELLTTGDGTEGQLLIPRTIAAVLIDAVEKALIPRELAAQMYGPGEIKGSSIDVNLVTADSMRVREVPEGSAVPLDVVEFTSINLRPRKYGVRPLITSEMIEDSLFGQMQIQMAHAGREMAENETGLVITALDGAANTVAGGAAITIANITTAMQFLEDSDFAATDMLLGPEVANDIRNIDTFVEANKLGSREMFERGFIGEIYGIRLWRVSSATGLITTTDSYVLDRNQAYAIAEKRPVTVEQYEDRVNDLMGAVVTQRLDVQLLRSAAVAKITTS